MGLTTAAPILPATVATATPKAASTTLTVAMTTAPVAAPVAALVTASTTMHVMSCAVEFDKGGQQSSSNHGKLQNHEQWLKWHHLLMGNAYEHKCISFGSELCAES